VVVGVAVIAALGGGIAIAANAPSPRQVVSAPQTPAEFVGITPVRVLDTRGAAGGPIGVPTAAKLGAGESINVAVGGVFGIPADAQSVAVNVTIDEDATLKSFLTIWPAGQARPNASANNAEPGLVSPNSAIFQLGADGKLSVFNQQGTVNVIIDVTGYFIAPGATGTTTTTVAGGTTTTAPGGTTTTTLAGTAAITTDAATYAIGAPVTVTGANWTGCTGVTIDLGATVVVPTVTVSGTGTFTAMFNAPSPVGTGLTVTAHGTPTPKCMATATIDITAAT